MRLIDADTLIEDYKKELEKVDFEKLSDNDKLIIATSAKALIDFAKRQPTVECGYNQALEDFARQLSVRLIELPLDDLIVADILNDVKGIYEQLKR